MTRRSTKRIIPYAITAIALISGAITIYEFVLKRQGPDENRVQAVACRKAGYEALSRNDDAVAIEKFKCALDLFKKSADSNDALSMWGAALVLGDENVTNLLTLDRASAVKKAESLWCRSREQGATASAGPPHFSPNLTC